MTKRERDSLIRKIARIEARVSKKRDELRACVGEIEGVLESVNAADDSMEGVIHNLRRAADCLDREVADRLSEYV